jgi:hypothetical protein
MRGRRPSGPEYVHSLEGSATAKERLQVVLETIAGRLRVQDACARLGISEQRFDQLRALAMQAAIERLESRPAGRPPPAPADEQVQKMQEQATKLEAELQAARARAEIALALPHVAQASEKKRANRRRQRH